MNTENKKSNLARSVSAVILNLELNGIVPKGQLARSTVHRLLKKHGISTRTKAGIAVLRRDS